MKTKLAHSIHRLPNLLDKCEYESDGDGHVASYKEKFLKHNTNANVLPYQKY